MHQEINILYIRKFIECVFRPVKSTTRMLFAQNSLKR